ncbi:Alpha/beta hydrolase domain-containing protein [Drosera capensis]
MSSCVRPLRHGQSTDPIVLLHGFDGLAATLCLILTEPHTQFDVSKSSFTPCLEWRFVMPLLEEAGLESWAVDILGWGFSDLGKSPVLERNSRRPSCNVASKRSHLYQKSYVKRPMILIGPSLGAAVAIDFSVNHPEAVALLKSMSLRLYVNMLALKGLSVGTNLDCMNDATVDFMRSGGYNVISLIKQVSQKTLVIWGEEDKIISYKFPVRLQCEMQDAKLRQIPDSGHIPQIERPKAVAGATPEFVPYTPGKVVEAVPGVVEGELDVVVDVPFVMVPNVGVIVLLPAWL